MPKLNNLMRHYLIDLWNQRVMDYAGNLPSTAEFSQNKQIPDL